MPGRPITDQQQRYYMSLRQKHPQKAAAAMAGFSTSTGYRQRKIPGRHRSVAGSDVMAAAGQIRSPNCGIKKSCLCSRARRA
jgi:hypothetical protein